MGSSEAYDCNRRSRRRNEDKRRRVEVAVVRLGPTPESGKALSEGIYRLYRNLVAQKSLDDQDRYYREWQSRAERKLAERTAIASGADTDLLAYVADVRELAARMDHLESLERRNLGRGKAIEQASKVTWADLSPQERRKAQQYLSQNVRPGDKTRRPAREAEFLGSVAALIEQATGSRISFSSTAPESTLPSAPRHHGVEFDVMMAAANMADCPLTNEAMARRIQRLRRQ
jgi:hypothetical protein